MLHTCAPHLVSFAVQDRTLKRWRAEGNHSQTIAKPHAARKSKPDSSTTWLKQPACPWPPNQLAAPCMNPRTIEKPVSVPVTANHPAIEPKVFRVDGHVLSGQVQTFHVHDAPARPSDVQASPPFAQPAYQQPQETYQQQQDKDAPHNFPSQKTTSVSDHHACGMQPKLASAAVSDSQSGASNKGLPPCANAAMGCEELADPASYKKNRCKGSSSCR